MFDDYKKKDGILDENVILGLSLKTLIAIGITVAAAVSSYWTLQADIQLAMDEPKPPVSRTEYELQTEMMDKAILETKKDISEIKKRKEKMEDRLFNQRR